MLSVVDVAKLSVAVTFVGLGGVIVALLISLDGAARERVSDADMLIDSLADAVGMGEALVPVGRPDDGKILEDTSDDGKMPVGRPEDSKLLEGRSEMMFSVLVGVGNASVPLDIPEGGKTPEGNKELTVSELVGISGMTLLEPDCEAEVKTPDAKLDDRVLTPVGRGPEAVGTSEAVISDCALEARLEALLERAVSDAGMSDTTAERMLDSSGTADVTRGGRTPETEDAGVGLIRPELVSTPVGSRPLEGRTPAT